MKTVIKRDGRKVDFKREKIINAVDKAFLEVEKEVNDTVSKKIADEIENIDDDEITVEQIQDLVEDKLMSTKYKNVARAYIRFRYNREKERDKRSKFRQLIRKKISGHMNEKANANMDELSFGGRIGSASDELMKEIALNEELSESAKTAHLMNRRYTHDLSHYAVYDHNCLSIPYDRLLKYGFNTRQTDIRPVRSISSALQIIVVVAQLQSLQQFGGVSATHLDFTLVPYVRFSFFKHYLIQYLKDNDEFDKLDIENMEDDVLDEWIDSNKEKYLKDMNLKFEDFRFDNKKNLDRHLYNCAMFDTRKELSQAVEAMYHNLNTLQSRSGNQLPFSSINYGTCTIPEGRMVIKALLHGCLDGVGKFEKTSVFPCGIFQWNKDINGYKGTPNYDLYQLALKCTSHRLYPNYANTNWSNQKSWIDDDRKHKKEILDLFTDGEKEKIAKKISNNSELSLALSLKVVDNTVEIDYTEHPMEIFSTMGCVDGKEIITYKHNGILYVESFERMWERISDNYEVLEQIKGNKDYLYINTNGKLLIYDTNKGFVNVKKLIRNLSNDWYNLKFSNGRNLLCTNDHPLPTNRGRIFAENLVLGDKVTINPNQYSEETINFNEKKSWLLGMIICDGSYDGKVTTSIALDSENDVEKEYISRMKDCFNIDVKTIVQKRGTKGNYKDLVAIGSITKLIDYLSTKFEGLTKIRRHIPNEVFSWNYSSKLSFLAGMIDADGYINPTTHGGSVVQLGSTNKELSLQQMALAQSLGMPAKVYVNHYSKKKPNVVRYRVEFVPSKDLLKFIVSGKKLNNFVAKDNEIVHFDSYVSGIEHLTNYEAYSYDVETDSDHFEVSGIYSHNCRTANGGDINYDYDIYFNNLKRVLNDEPIDDRYISSAQKDGRGNIAPQTIILPTLAMEVMNGEGWDENFKPTQTEDKIELFMEYLDFNINESRKDLYDRFKGIASQSENSSKFMYENDVMVGYKSDEGIESAVKHGTLAIGQLGLAETLQILLGCDQTEEKGMVLAKRIEDLFKTRCDEFKHKYHLNYGVYYTPAENLSYTAMTNFIKRFGNVFGDRKFFTNSMHVPVWKDISVKEKIDIESQLTGYSNAGCITYVELKGSIKHNLVALEKIVNYAMEHDIPYFAINVPNDMCTQCGYTDEINKCCPMCGCNVIRRLRRVTGYLTGDYLTAFNDGKIQEVEMRVKHGENI